MTAERKKWIVLGCLVVFWIALMVVQRSQMRNTRPTASVPRRGVTARREGSTTRVQKQGKQRLEMPRLQLNQLERVRPPFEPEARNIFASIDASSAFPPSVPSTPQAATTPPLPPPPDPFLEDSQKVRFLGYAEADGRATAFVSYEGEVLVVPETGVIGRLLQVKEITEDVLILSSRDGTKEVRLELGPAPGRTFPNRTHQRGNQP